MNRRTPLGTEYPSCGCAGRDPWPRVSLMSSESALIAVLEMPGLQLGDVSAAIEGRDLVVRGHVRAEAPEGAVLVFSERPSGRFERRISLPAEVDVAGTSARLGEGMLRVEMPVRRRGKRIVVE